MMQFPYFICDKGGGWEWGGGGQTSGIIVARATGCPEEEVSTELYANIQGLGGAWQGG